MDRVTIYAPLAGWVIPLGEVPDPVFSEQMLGDGVAIDPTGETLFAPCDAEVLTVNEARHALSLRCENGAEIILHLGIDTVGLRGERIEALVEPGNRVRTGDPLLRFDLDFLVQRAPSVATPILVCDGSRFSVEVLADGLVSPGDPLLRVIATGADGPVQEGGSEIRARTVEVTLPHGIHARPAARIAQAIGALSSTAFLVAGEKRASASSPVAMLGLGVRHGSALTIEASGRNAGLALEAIAAVLCDSTAEDSVTPPFAPVSNGRGLPGVPAAPGVAIGSAFWLKRQRHEIDQPGEGVAAERHKLEAALGDVRHEMRALAVRDGSAGAVIAAQLALLEDPALSEAAFAEIERGTSAGAAWRKTTEAQAGVLTASGDARIAERAEDLRDLEGRVLSKLVGGRSPANEAPVGAMLLAEELLPSEVIGLDPRKVAGIALVRGGPTSHAAILAAGMGLPMAVAFGEPLEQIEAGATLILDADSGSVEADPPGDRLQEVRSRLERRSAAETAARASQGELCRTSDGTRVEVFANLGSLGDAEAAVAEGAEGCGLLRTEFLFLDRTTPPTEAEQTAQYQAIADCLGERPLIVRLLDIGGDKPAPYLDLPPEENPALGQRGIRLTLARTELLETQIRAILAVKPEGRCRIMAPMVASRSELEAVTTIIAALGGGVEVGVMVETPAAAMTADMLARDASFLSIGSNDLTQYALAMDRGNAAVAAGVDGLHPAVLRLIARTCEDAARYERLVAVCGGLAADPLAIPILIGLGVRELSVPPARVTPTKALVRELTVDFCQELAAGALTLDSAAAVRALAASLEGARQ